MILPLMLSVRDRLSMLNTNLQRSGDGPFIISGPRHATAGAMPGMRTTARSLSRKTGRWSGICLTLALVAACTETHVRFPVSEEAQRNLPEGVEVIRLDASNISSFTKPVRGYQATRLPAGRDWTYLVGPTDVLSVIVFDHPELTLPAGPERSAEESGFNVQSDGTFYYPFVGQVRASGRRPEQIREDLTVRLAEFIPSPQLEVRVATFNSQSVVVAGEIKSPNRQRLTTVPLSLVEAINAAGGFTDNADLRGVTVQRQGTLYPVDVEGFLSGGLTQNNPILRNGDVVNVPRRRALEAYLLGEIARPNVMDLSREPVTLTQAITRLGGLQAPRADARGIFVFRIDGALTRVFQLDLRSPTGLLLGTQFLLEPGDVVYSVRTPLQRWNDTITQLLPTVQAVSAVDSLAN